MTLLKKLAMVNAPATMLTGSAMVLMLLHDMGLSKNLSETICSVTDAANTSSGKFSSLFALSFILLATSIQSLDYHSTFLQSQQMMCLSELPRRYWKHQRHSKNCSNCYGI